MYKLFVHLCIHQQYIQHRQWHTLQWYNQHHQQYTQYWQQYMQHHQLQYIHQLHFCGWFQIQHIYLFLGSEQFEFKLEDIELFPKSFPLVHIQQQFLQFPQGYTQFEFQPHNNQQQSSQLELFHSLQFPHIQQFLFHREFFQSFQLYHIQYISFRKEYTRFQIRLGYLRQLLFDGQLHRCHGRQHHRCNEIQQQHILLQQLDGLQYIEWWCNQCYRQDWQLWCKWQWLDHQHIECFLGFQRNCIDNHQQMINEHRMFHRHHGEQIQNIKHQSNQHWYCLPQLHWHSDQRKTQDSSNINIQENHKIQNLLTLFLKKLINQISPDYKSSCMVEYKSNLDFLKQNLFWKLGLWVFLNQYINLSILYIWTLCINYIYIYVCIYMYMYVYDASLKKEMAKIQQKIYYFWISDAMVFIIQGICIKIAHLSNQPPLQSKSIIIIKQMQKTNTPTYVPIQPQKLITAFKIMRENIGQSNLIAQANSYFRQCERNPQFSFVLIDLFHQASEHVLKQQILGLLKNIIQRNWTVKRRTTDQCYLTEEEKDKIRNNVLDLYKIYWQNYYKLFNMIFSEIAKQDFPTKYPSLYNFIASVLNTIATYNLDQILSACELLPYLSTTKKVLKNYGKRRILHSKQEYREYFQPLLQASGAIFTKLGEALSSIINTANQLDGKLMENLLECSRKIDKIILYGIQSLSPDEQKNEVAVELCRMMVAKLNFMLGISLDRYMELVQKNILALIEGLSKLQNLYPFTFTTFLKDYLQLILNTLFNNNFQNPKLINQTIKACKKPLQIYSYYMQPKQFSESIYCVKGNSSMYINEQQYCYSVYQEVYGGDACCLVLERCVGELMIKYQRENEDDEMIFEDVEPGVEQINSEDMMAFDLVIQLVKGLLKKFPGQLKIFVNKIYQYLLNNMESSSSSKLVLAMHEIVLMLPKTYNQNNLNLETIYQIMQKTYMISDLKMFPRYIRNYQEFLPEPTLQKSFEILTHIISSENIQPSIVYQCAVCIRRLIQNQDIAYDLNSMSICLSNIFKLLHLYKTDPNHLWNLLNLLNQIIMALSTQSILSNIPLIMDNIGNMLSQGGNTIVTLQAITDLLENIVEILTAQKNQHCFDMCFRVNQLCVRHIEEAYRIFNNSEEGIQMTSLFRLWLAVMKNHSNLHSTQQFNNKLISMYQHLQEQTLNQDPIILCQIIEQYILSQLFTLQPQDMINLFNKIKGEKSVQHEPRIFIALYSIYYTYSLYTNSYVPEIIANCMQDLRTITNSISPSQNALRSQLLMIICYHVIVFGADNVYGLFGRVWSSYVDWFWPIVWSLDYINHRYARKVIGIALLQSLQCLGDDILRNSIQGHMPIDFIVKFLLNCLEPMQHKQAMSSYMGAIRMALHVDDTLSRKKRTTITKASRKIYLHVNKSWSETELQAAFKEKLTIIWKRWDWGSDDIEEHYSKNQCNKILGILN